MHIFLRDNTGKLLARVAYGTYGSSLHRIFCTEPGEGKLWTQYGDLWNIPNGGTLEIIGS